LAKNKWHVILHIAWELTAIAAATASVAHHVHATQAGPMCICVEQAQVFIRPDVIVRLLLCLLPFVRLN